MAIFGIAQVRNRALEVDVAPGERKKLRAPGAGCERHRDEEVKARPGGGPTGLKQPLELVLREEAHNRVTFGCALDPPRGIVPAARREAALDRPGKERLDRGEVAVAGRSRAQPLSSLDGSSVGVAPCVDA